MLEVTEQAGDWYDLRTNGVSQEYCSYNLRLLELETTVLRIIFQPSHVFFVYSIYCI